MSYKDGKQDRPPQNNKILKKSNMRSHKTLRHEYMKNIMI